MQSSLLYPLIVFCSFLISLLVVSVIKKVYYYVKYKKRFYILPRVSIKGIANIAMVIAISIAIIILLTIVTADIFNIIFRAWPGTRVTIEGFLIKIGGLLFGPYLGLFIGAMTDLLTVALTAGVFHYGYLVVAMAYGLISGIISEIFLGAKNKIGWKAILGSIMLVVCMMVISFFFMMQTDNLAKNFTFSIFSFYLVIDSKILLSTILGFIVLCVGVVWLSFGLYHKKEKALAKQTELADIELRKVKTYEFYSSVIIVLVVSTVCNSIINLLILPAFDAQLSTIPYNEWIVLRAATLIPEVVLNCVVIVPIYNIVKPVINYNYKDDLLEDIKYPLYVD